MRLEGTAGGREFSDAGLQTLAGAPKLTQLEIYGAGFTDAGLPSIGQASQLRRLVIVDAAINASSLDALKATKPGFSWSTPSRR